MVVVTVRLVFSSSLQALAFLDTEDSCTVAPLHM